ncbi:MAG: site-specific DNA-methyltransferase [Candidatus Woesearchaeota archaeon]
MSNQKEKLFFDKLKDIFIGAKIEGESGFINLMKIKSSYFDIIFSELQKEIQEKTKEFPDFKEEMFDKLHTFFKTYFSESGSIYFSYTPLKSKIYEKVYTNNKDVALFWKTHMLYYVKTDKIWHNLTVDFDEEGVKYKINFDVSNLEHKKANEKRNIIYELKSIKNKEITFTVIHSEKGKVTKTDDILKEFKKNQIFLDEERLNKIFRIFEKQNEVDYFINKDAEKFLKEQFEIWLKDYVLDEKSIFDEKRLKELKVLKETAFKVIDFVAQFEDELVKIWNKPKFVLNSNYVITLDRIKNIKLIERIVKHQGFEKQCEEWKDLGILEKFEEDKLFTQTPKGKELNKEYSKLPIDTKYFDEEIKLEILSQFEDLDKALDGWLIHSENYQALKTILPKFREKVQTIYIDPPFNLGTNADFLYNVNYKDASWITLLENRLHLARDLLNEKGSIFVRCDYNGNMYVRLLMNNIFGEENFRNEIIVNRTLAKQPTFNQFIRQTESLFLFSKTKNNFLKKILRSITEPKWYPLLHFPRPDKKPRIVLGKTFYPPRNRRWARSQEDLERLEKLGKVRINEKVSYIDCFGNLVKGFPEILYDEEVIDNAWLDIPGYSQTAGFPTENSEILLKRVIESTSNEGDLVMDFFLGSGTTTAVAHKLGRKWIGVEMGEHFYTVVLPRMKKVLAYDKSGISKEKDVKEKYNENKAGGFFKYYELEQYEQTLKKCRYKPSEPFLDLKDKSIYQQYVFMKDLKLLEAMELDYKNDKIKIDFSKIYPNIDLAETLSNLTGKCIKKITKDCVEFEDNTKIDFNNIDFKLIKPLILW